VLTGGEVTAWLVVVQTQSSAFLLEFLCYKVNGVIHVHTLIFELWTCNLISTLFFQVFFFF
jgi:hypothetical protein